MLNLVMFIAFALMMSGCAGSPSMSDAMAGDVERGAQLFAQSRDEAPPCLTCHRIVSGQVGFSIGPNLAGIAEHAGAQMLGLTTEEYLRQSIVEPRCYIVSGYRDIMCPDYSTHLTERDVQDLIAYLFTL
jgi:cytochrome c2